MSFNRLIAGLALLLLLAPLSAFAAVTGNLFGVVTDDSGAVLPGVTVTVRSPQLQGTRDTVTNAQGEYNLQLLPPGTYSVEFTLEGLKPVTREGVQVQLDQTTKINATLSMGAVTEAITVTADAVVVDPTQTTVQQNFSTEHLEYASIGSAGRSYQSVVQQAPGVAGGANPQVMGANLGQNNFMLDGVNTTDPVTHTFGSNLPFDAIQEVSIQTLGKDAEYGRAVGGVINVVTKTGGNVFSGSADLRYTGNDLAENGDHTQLRDQDYEEIRPSVTFGGPIKRDKIWFFASAQRPDTTRINAPIEGSGFTPGGRTFEGLDTLAKITAAIGEGNTLSLRYTDNQADIENSENSAYYSPEADSFQTQRSTIWNVGYDATLSNTWLASAQVGYRTGSLETRPMSGSATGSAVIDLRTGIQTGNYDNWQYSDRDRVELVASTTYFVDSFYGSHTLKAGTNIDRSEFLSSNNVTGTAPAGLCGPAAHLPAGAQCGAVYSTLDGAPYYVTISTLTPEETYKSNLSAFYVQDEWHPVSAVTARLGLRYERVSFDVPGRDDVPELSKLQPRIGLAWDMFNDASTVLHGFWGQVMDDNGLTLASFGSTIGSVSTLMLYNNATGAYDRYYTTYGGASGNTYDPNLKATYSNEANIGITRRIGSRNSVDLTAVWRDTKNLFEDTCFDQADCTYYWLTNSPAGEDDILKSKYTGVIARLESRPFDWLQGLVSYTWSKSQGSVGYTQNAGADFDVYPDHFVNRYGYLDDDARHRVKASGFVRAPFGTTFGIDYTWDSGQAYSVTASTPPTSGYGTLYVEPRGSKRLPDFQQLDLQVQHDFNIGRYRPSLIAAVYNVLGTEIVTSRTGSIGEYAECDGTTNCVANPLAGVAGEPAQLAVSSSFGQATSWQAPRRYELGVRFSL
ncbi:MAG: TonB-dependent receptor [Thermoanaerobaculia bacterium]